MGNFLDLLRSGMDFEYDLIVGGLDMPATLVWSSDCRITDYGIEKFRALMDSNYEINGNTIVLDCNDYKLGTAFSLESSGYVSSSEFDRMFYYEEN